MCHTASGDAIYSVPGRPARAAYQPSCVMLARVALASAIPARSSFSISIRRPPGAGVAVGEGTPTPAALLAALAALVTPLLTVFRPVLMSCQRHMETAISKG